MEHPTMNIRTILCPTDLSEPSRHALDHAVAIADWYSARVVVLHVQEALAAAAAIAGTGSMKTGGEAEIGDLRRDLDRETHAARARGVEVETAIVPGSGAAATIADYAKRSGIDLIVIGTHGLGGFRHLLLGSVTETVLRQASCPVLTVPPRAHAISTLPFKRLLWPTDFSSSSLAALEIAFLLAQQAQASLTLMNVLAEADENDLFVARPYDIHHHAHEVERRAREHLQQLVPDAVKDWASPAVRVARGIAEEEILRVAADESIDLIVMGIQGRRPLELMVFGSTTNQVVRRARCPVLTVRRS
jgi:nucleotide-binding universal stress UspA family protein